MWCMLNSTGVPLTGPSFLQLSDCFDPTSTTVCCSGVFLCRIYSYAQYQFKNAHAWVNYLLHHPLMLVMPPPFSHANDKMKKLTVELNSIFFNRRTTMYRNYVQEHSDSSFLARTISSGESAVQGTHHCGHLRRVGLLVPSPAWTS